MTSRNVVDTWTALFCGMNVAAEKMEFIFSHRDLFVSIFHGEFSRRLVNLLLFRARKLIKKLVGIFQGHTENSSQERSLRLDVIERRKDKNRIGQVAPTVGPNDIREREREREKKLPISGFSCQ